MLDNTIHNIDYKWSRSKLIYYIQHDNNYIINNYILQCKKEIHIPWKRNKLFMRVYKHSYQYNTQQIFQLFHNKNISIIHLFPYFKITYTNQYNHTKDWIQTFLQYLTLEQKRFLFYYAISTCDVQFINYIKTQTKFRVTSRLYQHMLSHLNYNGIMCINYNVLKFMIEHSYITNSVTTINFLLKFLLNNWIINDTELRLFTYQLVDILPITDYNYINISLVCNNKLYDILEILCIKYIHTLNYKDSLNYLTQYSKFLYLNKEIVYLFSVHTNDSFMKALTKCYGFIIALYTDNIQFLEINDSHINLHTVLISAMIHHSIHCIEYLLETYNTELCNYYSNHKIFLNSLLFHVLYDRIVLSSTIQKYLIHLFSIDNFLQKQYKDNLADSTKVQMIKLFGSILPSIKQSTEDTCCVMYNRPIYYMHCKSNVPHCIGLDVFQQLTNNKCPYCRSNMKCIIYENN